ncbi:protein yellow-like [Cloeon dipterum]|uniref:protein yellow-like n=1 Tax=Cloeon dipterum TaxID=197152 RepID=UPI0032207BE3
MSALFSAIFLLGLCLANAVNFTNVYEWDKLFDFVWPLGVEPSIGQIKDEFLPGNVKLKFMAVFGQRLFLSLYFNRAFPATLAWLPTSGTPTAHPKLIIFPFWHLHKRDDCYYIQSAQGMETDTDGRLWVLDLGSSKCSSKIWIFNLLKHDTTEHVHHFPDVVVSHSHWKTLPLDIVLDKTPDDYLAYITDLRSEHIIVYSRKTDKSWTVKTPGRKWHSLALSADREARQLYLGRFNSKEMYSVSVSELKSEGGSAAVKLIGEWTGKSSRMLIDSFNVLYAAFTEKSYLSKWNISEPFLEQRTHEVGTLDAIVVPFTFALDTNGTFWMTETNETG